MLAVQQMASPIAAPPIPELIRPFHGRINPEAAESILQLTSADWASLQRTSTATSRSVSDTAITNSSSISSQSSLPTTKSQPFTIQPAHHSHAEQICHIGKSVFAATFGFSIPPADLTTYLAESYNLAAIQAELASPNHYFLVAVDTARPKAEQVLGFAQITYHTTEPCISHLPQESLVEFQRLYVSKGARSLGVGRALLIAAQDAARSRANPQTSKPSITSQDDDCDCDADSEDNSDNTSSVSSKRKRNRASQRKQSKKPIYMWLGVWEGNFVAQNVYEKAGFERVGEHEFRMGRCVQIDWIMLKELL